MSTSPLSAASSIAPILEEPVQETRFPFNAESHDRAGYKNIIISGNKPSGSESNMFFRDKICSPREHSTFTNQAALPRLHLNGDSALSRQETRRIFFEASEVAPSYIDANTLTVEQYAELVKTAHICRAAMNTYGNFQRGSSARMAHYLSDVTNLNGSYDIHPTDSETVIGNLSRIGTEARRLFQKNFPAGFVSLIDKGIGSFVDDKTGLCANFLYSSEASGRKPRVSLVFLGTGAAGKLINHISDDFSMIAGRRIPPSFHAARSITGLFKDSLKDECDLEVCGFSLGGALATFSGLIHELKVTTLCPLPLSFAAMKYVIGVRGESVISAIREKVSHLSLEGDTTSGRLSIARMSRSFEKKLSVPMPHIFGETHIIRSRDIPETWKSTKVRITGYGIHAFADELWALQHVKKTGAPFPPRAESNTPSADEKIGRPRVSASSLEYDFLVASNKFEKRMNSLPMMFQKTHTLSRLEGLTREVLGRSEADGARDLQVVESLESLIREVRMKNSVSSLRQPVRDLYKAAATQRHRLNIRNAIDYAVKSSSIRVPENHRASVFSKITESARSRSENAVIRAENVHSRDNRMMPRVMLTGDEFGPAMYALISNAQKKVTLETYLFYEKSEAARWLYAALHNLQKKQSILQAGKKDGCISPVKVEIILDDSRGLAKQDSPGNGGIFQNAKRSLGLKRKERKNTVSNYGIGYPAELDPNYVKIRTFGLKHFARGTMHSKSVIVDDDIGVVSTNNFKGTHHAVSMDGLARFDASVIIKGGAVRAMNDEFDRLRKRSEKNVLGGNENFRSRVKAGEDSFSPDHLPTVYGRQAESCELFACDVEKHRQRSRDIIADVELFKSDRTLTGTLPITVIAQGPNNRMYSRKPESPQRNAFLCAMKEAKYFIRISGTNLNVPEIIDSLVEATRRNVMVEAVLPDDALEILCAIDAKTNIQAYGEIYDRVLDLGKKDFLDLRWQTSPLGSLVQKPGQSHMKYFNIDGVSLFGSTNLDVQSWKYSSELTLALERPAESDMLNDACFMKIFERAIPFRTDAAA